MITNYPLPQHAGLRLSADLLRAILLNCLAYSESTKRAKTREESLQSDVERLNAELRRYATILLSDPSIVTNIYLDK